MLLALVSMRVMTRLLSGEEVGHVYLILSFASYFSLVFLSPVGLYITRRLHSWHQAKVLPSRYKVYHAYVAAVSLLSIPVLYLVKVWFGIGAGIPTGGMLAVVAAFIYFGTWNSTFIPALNMLNYRRSFVLLTTSTLLLCLLFSAALVVWGPGPGGLFWLAGQIAGLAALAAAALAYLGAKVWRGAQDSSEAGVSPAGLKSVYRFSLPLLVTSLFMWLQSQSYRVIVEHNIGPEFLGMMAVGLGIASSVGAAVEALLQQVYYPIYYSEINTDDQAQRKRAWQKMAGVMLPLYLLIMLFVSFLARHLVTVLVDPKFSAAAFFTVFGAWLEFSRITANILSSVAHSEMRTDYLAKPYAYGGLFSVLGVAAGSLLPGYRYLVPAALVLGGGLTLYHMAVNMRKIMPLNINRKELRLALLLSLPLPLALLVPGGSLPLSIGVLAVFGAYLLWAQYLLYRRAGGEGVTA